MRKCANNSMMDDLKSLVKCGLCNSVLKSPRRLPCCHQFCESCLLEYTGDFIDKPSFPCPKCGINITPQAPFTKICRHFIDILPKDDVSSQIINLIDLGRNERDFLATITDIPCVKHQGSKITIFCKECNVCLCEICKVENHASCETLLLEGNVSRVLPEQKQKCIQVMANVKVEISNLHHELLPRQRQLLMKKEETALGISNYFSEIRNKVTKYLLKQEQKIQEDLEHLVALEKTHISDEVKISSSVLDVLEKDTVTMTSLMRNQSQVASNEILCLHLLSLFQRQSKDYQEKTNEMNQDPPETRFIINTELEDLLTNCDLVKIEVVNTRQYDKRKESHRTHEPGGGENSESGDEVGGSDRDDDQSSSEPSDDEASEEDDESSTSSDEDVENETSSSEQSSSRAQEGNQSAEASSGAGVSTTANTGAEQRNVVIEVNYPDEPPPPYPGLIQSTTASSKPPQASQNVISSDVSEHQNKTPVSREAFHHPRPVPSAPPAPSNDDVLNQLIQESLLADSGASPSFRGGSELSSSRNSLSTPSERSPRHSPQPLRRPRPPPPVRSPDSRPSSSKFFLDRIWQANTMAVGEQRTPRIFGMVWLDGVNLLAADRWNHRLKVINRGTVIHVFSLGSYQPWDVAKMANNLSAVAVPEAKMIYIVAFRQPELQIRRKIVTKRGYSSLTYNADKKVFVCTMIPQFHNPPGVDVLDADGRHVTSYFPMNVGRSFLAYPRGIELTSTRTVLTDFQKKSMIFLKVMDRKIMSNKYMGTEAYPLREPNGMAVNYRDKYIMVIDTRSNKIHVVSESGHFIGMVETDLDHDDPCMIAINLQNDPCLAVAFGNGVIVNYRLIQQN